MVGRIRAGACSRLIKTTFCSSSRSWGRRCLCRCRPYRTWSVLFFWSITLAEEEASRSAAWTNWRRTTSDGSNCESLRTMTEAWSAVDDAGLSRFVNAAESMAAALIPDWTESG